MKKSIKVFPSFPLFEWRHDIRYNDTRHTVMMSGTFFAMPRFIALSVVMSTDVIVSVITPSDVIVSDADFRQAAID